MKLNNENNEKLTSYSVVYKLCIIISKHYYNDTNEIPSGLLRSATDPIPPSLCFCWVEQRLPIVDAVLVIGVFKDPGVEIEEVTGNENPETGVAVGVNPVDVNVSKLRLGTMLDGVSIEIPCSDNLLLCRVS